MPSANDERENAHRAHEDLALVLLDPASCMPTRFFFQDVVLRKIVGVLL